MGLALMGKETLRRPIQAGETRTADRLRYHYRVEKELAARLKNASTNERSRLYSLVYDELFSTIEDHPGRTRTPDSATQKARVSEQLGWLEPFLRPDHVYLEIGAGNGALALQVASRVRKVYALDVSKKILEGVPVPQNLEAVIVEGVEIPVPAGSVDVAYSNQLTEHLHEEDAKEQVANIYRSLKTGGKYVCVTPNRLTGPHDISGYFDRVASGLHLKEYTMGDLSTLMTGLGFRNVTPCYMVRGRVSLLAVGWVKVLERMLMLVPHKIRCGTACSRLVCHCVIATK